MKLRVDYIKRNHKNKSYSYPFLVSSYRDEKGTPQRKVLLNLSCLPEHSVNALASSLKHGPSPDMVPVEGISFSSSLSLGACWSTQGIMKELKIPSILEKFVTKEQLLSVTAMIIDRVINPQPYSKNALAKSYSDSVLRRILQVEAPGLETWYDSLDVLFNNQEEIEEALFNEVKEKVERIFLYDITSVYFEGECCNLSEYGYNRDKKGGKQQIVVGLLTTSEGRPISVKVFSGNTNDQTTLLEQVKEVSAKFGAEELVFVGDRGMITSKRIEELEDIETVKYITALKRSEMMSLVEDLEHPMQLGMFDKENICEVEYDGRRYILCHNPLREKEDGATRERLIKKTEEKLSAISKGLQEGRLKQKEKIAKRLYRWLNNWKMEKFFEVNYDEGKFIYSRKEDEIKRYERLDGCYVLTTNLPKDKMDSPEVKERYKSLKYVEQGFRNMKTTDLFIRPIRHWLDTRVQGHVFVCMLAYLIIWEARRRLRPVLERDETNNTCIGGSLREIWDELNKIQIGKLKLQEKEIEQIGLITHYQRKILKLLGTPLNKKAIRDLNLDM